MILRTLRIVDKLLEEMKDNSLYAGLNAIREVALMPEYFAGLESLSREKTVGTKSSDQRPPKFWKLHKSRAIRHDDSDVL